jgi:cell fate regulator YaaT (PSP1 superfamily)
MNDPRPPFPDRDRDRDRSRSDRRGPRQAEPRNLVAARLTRFGRSYEYDAGDLTLRPGDEVVVDARRGGTELATVTVGTAWRTPQGPVGRVLRRAEDPDRERAESQQARAAEALAFARDRARARELPVKMFRVDWPPGGDKVMFYFSADQRVDFRDLVKDLAARYHARIELRQVGVRDEAKMVGGIGSCGRELCCTTFLSSFAPVSIKMAKNQNIALNPTKVSGQCGRLKCCLVYEEAQYVEAGKKLPKLGKRVETPEGLGRVEDLDILAGKIRVSFPDKPPMIFGAGDVRPAAPPAGPGRPEAPRRGSDAAPQVDDGSDDDGGDGEGDRGGGSGG